MALWTHKTEHAGAKNGGGYHGTRLEAKTSSNVGRRACDRYYADEGLTEYYEGKASAVAKRKHEALVVEATLTVADVTKGDLYRVIEHEAHEADRERLMTRSVERAVEKFNELVLAAGRYIDDVALSTYRCNDNGDYEWDARLVRPGIGDKLAWRAR